MRLVDVLNGITSIGFDYKIKMVSHGSKSAGNHHRAEMLCISLDSLTESCNYDNIIFFLSKMVHAAISGLCFEHALETFIRLDFSNLEKSYSDEEIQEIID